MRFPLRRSYPQEIDWAAIAGGEGDSELDDEVIDYTGPGTHFGLTSNPEITPPREVVQDSLGRLRLVRTDVDETSGRKPWDHRPDGRNYAGVPHELQRWESGHQPRQDVVHPDRWDPGSDTYSGPNIFYSR